MTLMNGSLGNTDANALGKHTTPAALNTTTAMAVQPKSSA
eukprot:CAMPEP_0172882816 /NCGR_PEP_ID=MMETSP1075-20121228/121147_1 /TAXON_ID=2916 /ORGANISM="Ceratium fusus, Strain PA161109" /LENGTH=39 /DNA_ID= /DNA_START= /DNA_END= /DNA_ORIENTATION=